MHVSLRSTACYYQKMHDLWSLYHATLAAPHLGVDMKTGGVLDKVLDLVQADGSVRCVLYCCIIRALYSRNYEAIFCVLWRRLYGYILVGCGIRYYSK